MHPVTISKGIKMVVTLKNFLLITKQLTKLCIYCGLMLAFICILIEAFENFLSENSGLSFKSVYEKAKMPSMTICPSMSDGEKSVNSSGILEYLKDIPMNISVELDRKE
jgi:hypothetical protein